MVITVPMALLVQRHQEYLVGLQVAQDFAAVVGFAHGVAQFAAKALLGRGVVEKRLDFGWQAVDDFFEQVIADQPFPAVQALGQGAFAAGFGGRQQPETQAGHPAFTASDQVIQGFAAQ